MKYNVLVKDRERLTVLAILKLKSRQSVILPALPGLLIIFNLAEL